MSKEQLQEKAEALKGEEIKVDLTDGDQLQGLLNSIRINTKTLEVAVEVTDTEGKGILIPLKLIDDIEPVK